MRLSLCAAPAPGAGDLTATLVGSVHAALEPLLLRLSAGRLPGGNAGAVALLTALADLVHQYVTPAQRELRRDLPDQVAEAVAQLARRRPLSVAMENVSHRLEQVIRHELPADRGDFEVSAAPPAHHTGGTAAGSDHSSAPYSQPLAMAFTDSPFPAREAFHVQCR